MRRSVILALGVAALAACGGGGDAAGDYPTDTTTASIGPAPGDSAMPFDTSSGPMGVDSGSAAGAHLTLAAVGGSTASGMAMLTQQEDSLSVEVSVSNAPASESLAAHLHRGRCGSDQGVAAPLDPVNTVEDGSGSRTTMLSRTVMSGDLFVQVHGVGGAPILCADVPSGS